MTLRCTYPGCEVVIARPNPRRKTTMCRSHANAAAARCPEKRERTAATMRATIASRPGYKRECAERSRQVMAVLMRDPEIRAQYVESGRRLGYDHQGNLFRTSENRARSAAKVVATKLAHIPLEYRQLYYDLRRHNLTAAERASAVQVEIEKDAERHRRTGQLPRTGGK